MWSARMRRSILRRRDVVIGAWALAIAAALAAVPAGAQEAAADAVLEAPAMLGAKSTAATGLAGDTLRTRFVIGLEKSVEFQVSSLANPNRVVVEMPDVKLQMPQQSSGHPVGLVQSFRAGVAQGKVLVVIQVTGPVVVEKSHIEKSKDGSHPPRLVLEIVPAESVTKAATKRAVPAGAQGLGAAGLQPPLPKPAARPQQRAANIFKPIIVIDPGHGGHDSGASRNGTVEKDVVLAFSLRLREKLEKSGRYKVLMTRESDTFVDLDERRAFADRSKASLFIAVHADDSGGNSSARGATIYSLRDSLANELQRAAQRKAGSEILTGRELTAVRADNEEDISAVKSFLADLQMKELVVNRERTKMFAGAVVETMGETTNLMSNPDREAGFRVLKSAKMPSVLIELAYVTNRSDAANLKSDTWREKVSGSIVDAVDNYFSHHAARLPM